MADDAFIRPRLVSLQRRSRRSDCSMSSHTSVSHLLVFIFSFKVNEINKLKTLMIQD